MSAFTGKTLMITGGTGSFGSTVLKRFLTDYSAVSEHTLQRVRRSRTAFQSKLTALQGRPWLLKKQPMANNNLYATI